MFKQKVQDEVQNQYDKLIKLGYNVVGIFLYGSQNYELDYEKSDVDTKAIVVPSLNDIVMNKQPISTTIDMGNGCLCDVKDIRKMFECFKKQNINFIELLFTNYYVLNEDYKELYMPMMQNADSIARYNNYAGLNCMYGMAMEKQKALTHPYPSIKDKVEKYGYDNKQLHHIVRMNEFMQRYIAGDKYSEILIPHQKEWFLSIKKDYVYPLGLAKYLSKSSCENMKWLKDGYMESHPLEINKYVADGMNEVCYNIIRHAIEKEIS